MSLFSEIQENYVEISDTIRGACFRSKRDVKSVHFLAVSKLQSIDAIKAAYELGIRDFGENYIQELLEKKETLKDLKDIRWHLIGVLQSNKIKSALENCASIQSISSEKLALEISSKHKALKLNQPIKIFIQVNIDCESSKSGAHPNDVPALAATLRTLPEIELIGLMCIPKLRQNLQDLRPVFKKMRELLSLIEIDKPLELSMGMSEDFEIAIEEGSHWVRVGRRLFGERK